MKISHDSREPPEWWLALVQIWTECASNPALLLGFIVIIYLYFLAFNR
ncbi:MAG: hypothetical protein M0Z50_00945 [Planctomycetia bacterium]|nr:hypothetical protein [Planctomycetia bacterium]